MSSTNNIHTITGTLEEQILIEEASKASGVKKFINEMQSAIANGRLSETPYGALLMKVGYDTYRDKLREYFDADLSSNSLKLRNLIMLIQDDVDVLAYEVLTAVINNSSGNNNNSIVNLSRVLVNRLFNNYVYGQIKIDNPKLHTYLGYEFRRASKRRKKELIELNIKSLYDEFSVPNRALRLQIGTMLVNLLELSGANIIEVMTTTTYNGGKQLTQKTWKLTEEAVDLMSSVDLSAMALKAVERAPSIVPPKDWTNAYDGGYHTFKDKLVKFFYFESTEEFRQQHTYRKILPVINKLQRTGWRVNARLLELVDYVFENDIPLGDLPPSIPKTWKDFMTMPEYDEKNKMVWVEANKKRQQIQIDLDSDTSRRIMLKFSLATAKNMLKYDAFYYSYMLDYRGRVYPTSSHLNFLGRKEVKSLIEFAEGEYLTPDGVRWLKIHIANTFGLDKEPYDERVEWVDDNYDTIMAVASDPLGAMNVLSKADSPFEFTAACMAFNDHLCGDKVHVPIQLDATCSGIQMYSGLLRDEIGALSVNVIGDTRNDIYQQVADKVEYKLQTNEYDSIVTFTDSEGEQRSVLTDATANSLRGNISRKIVKRPTMTVPYSVTMRGMSNQIDDELRDIEEKGKAFWKGDRWVANKLITSLTSTSIYSILDGAKKGQEYLVELSRTLDRPATWTTPVYDFPVIQNTMQTDRKRVDTVYGALSLQIEGIKHDKRKQANQIAPNFIHSIDSTVLLGVIDYMESSIGTIHDCFLVSPNNGYEVQEAYRHSFVETMKADPLKNIQEQLDPLEVVEFPMYGDLDLDDVYKAQYIIS